MPKSSNRKTAATPKKIAVLRYPGGRVVQPWNTPLRIYVSCLTTAAYDDGKRGQQIVDAVTKIVPRWRSFFDTAPTDTALISRAHNSRCGPTSKTEAPEVNERKKAIWPVAKRDYKTGRRTFALEGKRAA